MDTQKLHDLIDKVIGKKGPLRVTAYWMRKTLNSIVKHSDALHSTALNEINKRQAFIFSKVLQIPLQFTYQELAELALAAKLVPGQQYILKDYEFTTSAQFAECAGFTSSTVTSHQRIILTAQSTETFSSYAKYIAAEYGSAYPIEWDIVFFFFGNEHYAWNRHTNEVPSFTATDTEGNSFEFTLSSVQSSNIYYSDNEGRSWSTSSARYNIGDNSRPVKYLSVGSKITLSSSGSKSFTVTSVSKPFKGLIAKAYASGKDVELPYDPYCSQSSFDLYLPDGSSIACRGGSFNPNITKFTLKPLKKGELIYPPRIAVSYKGDKSCYIGPNCDKVYIFAIDDGPFYIEGNCQDIYIPDKDKGQIRIYGPCSRLSIESGGLYLTALGKCTDIEFVTGTSGVPACFVVLHNDSYLKLDRADSTVLFIGKDSNDNVVQWNPADIVNMQFVVAGALNDLNKRLLEQ